MVGPLGLIPPLPPGIKIRKDQWPRVYAALHLMAVTGVSTRIEVLTRLGGKVNGGWGQKLFSSLRREKLVDYAVIGKGRSRVGLVQLSPWGERVCRLLDLWPVRSEWSKLIEGHAGSVQQAHSASVLLFCFFAREFGWRVDLLPVVHLRECQPDVRITNSEEEVYVEVERLSAKRMKLQKWTNQERLQGKVAVCTTGPIQRQFLVKALRLYGLHGLATDLLTLRRGSPNLWVDEF